MTSSSDTRRTLVTNMFIVAAGAVATMAIGMALKILLARMLSVQDFGVVVSAQVMVGFVVVAASLSIPEAIVWVAAREFSRAGTAGPSIAAAYVLGLASGCTAMGAVMLTVALSRHAWQPPQLGVAVMWLAIMTPLNIVGDSAAGGLRAAGPLWPKVVALDVGRPALTLAFAGALGASGLLSVTSTIAALVAASALTAAVPISLAWRQAATKPVWSHAAAGMRPILKYGLPLLGASLLAGPIINNVIPSMLALTVSPQDVALYSVALALQVLVYMPTGAVEVALLPRWSAAGGPPKQTFQTVTRWSLMLASVPFAVLWLAPSEVLSLVYGSRYAGAGALLQVAASSALFAASVGPNEAALKAAGDTRGILAVRLIAAVSGLIVAGTLMPRWGALGAVVGFSVSSVMLNAIYAARLWSRKRVQPVSPGYVTAAAGMIAALVVTRFVLQFLRLGSLSVLAATASLYLLLLVLCLVMLRAEEPALIVNGVRQFVRGRLAMSQQ